MNPAGDSPYEGFKDLFPADTKIISINGTRERFEGVVRCRCKDKNDFVVNWLTPFEMINNVGLRICVTRPRTGKTVLFKGQYRCQHNTYPYSHILRTKKPHKKHTDCPAVLRVTIKADPGNRRIRSKDALQAEYPTIIVVIHNHNHEIYNSMDLIMHKRMKSLKKSSVSEEAKNDDDALFKKPKLLNHRKIGSSVVTANGMPHCTNPYQPGRPRIIVRTLSALENQRMNSLLKKKSGAKKRKKCNDFDMSIFNEYVHEELVETNENNCNDFVSSIVNNCAYEEMVATETNDVTMKTNKLNSYVIEETVDDDQDWSSLKNKFDTLFEKWEQEKSVEQFEALQVALMYLENCCDFKKTETTSIGPTSAKYYISESGNSNVSGIIVIEMPKSESVKNEQSNENSELDLKDFVTINSSNLTPPALESEVIDMMSNCVVSDRLPTQEEKLDNISTNEITLMDHRYVKDIGDVR